MESSAEAGCGGLTAGGGPSCAPPDDATESGGGECDARVGEEERTEIVAELVLGLEAVVIRMLHVEIRRRLRSHAISVRGSNSGGSAAITMSAND